MTIFFVKVALFRPDTNARSMLVKSRTHIHYPSQKQWLPGISGKQEPARRARLGAPTCPTLTDEQRQQRVGLRALPPSELLPKSAKERPRES